VFPRGKSLRRNTKVRKKVVIRKSSEGGVTLLIGKSRIPVPQSATGYKGVTLGKEAWERKFRGDRKVTFSTRSNGRPWKKREREGWFRAQEGQETPTVQGIGESYN